MAQIILRIMAYINRFFNKDESEFGQICNTSRDVKDDRDMVSYEPATSYDKFVIPDLPPIRSQKNLSSCASHGVIGCYEIQLPKGKFLEGSELFHYYNARKYVNNQFPADLGMTIRDACKTLKDWGYAFEFLCPYSISKFNERPSRMAYYFSKLYKIRAYHRLSSIDQIKNSISNKIPVACGICVNSNFYKLDRANYLYKPARKTIFGHCVIIVGFDDKRMVFTLRNSWGKGWGKAGYFEMPYSNFKSTSFDWWKILR